VTRYLVKRLGVMLFTLLVVVTVTFFLFRAVPGDPALVLIGPELEASAADSIRESFGLDQSLWTQYRSYLVNAAQGDMGVSFRYGLPVSTVLGVKLVNTIVLVLPAMLIAYALGSLLGSFAAARPNSRVDRLIIQTFLTIKSAPSFWVATMAMVLLSLKLGITPSGGMATPGAARLDGIERFLSGDFLSHLVLPLFILAVIFSVEPLLTMRTSMGEILDEDFIEFGHAKGLSRSRITIRHAARNSLLPMVSLLPSIAGHLIGGSVIIEIVFSWPGMGREIVDAVNRFDYPMMQGTFMAIAALAIVVNALADILYTYLDPRVRLT
jgi:ABC-type dipeptide/oligopeptide/nickel transport system permease component